MGDELMDWIGGWGKRSNQEWLRFCVWTTGGWKCRLDNSKKLGLRPGVLLCFFFNVFILWECGVTGLCVFFKMESISSCLYAYETDQIKRYYQYKILKKRDTWKGRVFEKGWGNRIQNVSKHVDTK